MSNEQAICPECNKPCGPLKLEAKVYHWSCLVKRFKALREEWEKETTEEKNQRMQNHQHPMFNIKGCQTGRFTG